MTEAFASGKWAGAMGVAATECQNWRQRAEPPGKTMGGLRTHLGAQASFLHLVSVDEHGLS
jgi:hypothetical protein